MGEREARLLDRLARCFDPWSAVKQMEFRRTDDVRLLDGYCCYQPAGGRSSWQILPQGPQGAQFRGSRQRRRQELGGTCPQQCGGCELGNGKGTCNGLCPV